MINGEEKFVTNYAKMVSERIFCALSGEGCGWSVEEIITRENIAKLKMSVREKLSEEIDKLSTVEVKKKDLPA